jgi:hypothetical protein
MLSGKDIWLLRCALDDRDLWRFMEGGGLFGGFAAYQTPSQKTKC